MLPPTQDRVEGKDEGPDGFPFPAREPPVAREHQSPVGRLSGPVLGVEAEEIRHVFRADGPLLDLRGCEQESVAVVTRNARHFQRVPGLGVEIY